MKAIPAAFKITNEIPKTALAFSTEIPEDDVTAAPVVYTMRAIMPFLPDSAFTASSFYDANTAPAKARLPGANDREVWAPRNVNTEQWWQADFGSNKEIVYFQIKGRASQWTTGFRLQYSLDGTTWTDYNNREVLVGNNNATTIEGRRLTMFVARYLRVIPVTWFGFPTGKFQIMEQVRQ